MGISAALWKAMETRFDACGCKSREQRTDGKFTDPAQFAIIKAEPNIAKEKNRA